MSTLNVKIPDEMEEDIEAFLERNPHYLNKSELVRDALRHMLTGTSNEGLSSQGEIAGEDPLFSAPAVTVDAPVDENDVDDVLYEKQHE